MQPKNLLLKITAYTIPFALILLWFLFVTNDVFAQGAVGAGENLKLDGWRLTVYNMITVIGAFFAWVGGFLLDMSISVFVANMAQTASYIGLTSLIKTLWTVIRDLFNLLFIFSLIWIGFQTILGTAGTDTKKWVANLVIAALLINFSLYIAQVVVDFSNVAAFQISEMMLTDTYSTPIFGNEIKDISGGFAAKTQLQNFPAESLQSLTTLMGPDSGISGAFAAIALGFMVMLMLIIMGFIFAAGAVILLTRFLALTFLMVFSPFLFIGLIWPDFKHFGKTWWKIFFSNALVGPAFLFMLYFSYRALDGFSTINDYTLTNILVYFIMVIGFMCLSLVVAKKIGSFGANQAVNFASKGAGVMTAGLTARAMQSTIGRLGQRIADSESLKDQASKRGIMGSLARGSLIATRKVGDASYDARNVSGVGKKLGAGETKGGFKTRRENYVKERVKFAESLGEVDDDDAVVTRYKNSLVDAENQVELLKDKKRKASKDDKEKIQGEIELAETYVKKVKGNLDREKSRRQIGSVEFAENKEKIETDLEKQKDLRKRYQTMFREASNNEERQFATDGYAKAKKEIAKLNKELRQGGLANIYKNSGFITSIISSGHMPGFNKQAGEEIAKKYAKKLKETDDDKRTARIADAVKESSKKE